MSYSLPEHFFRAPSFEARTPPGFDEETGDWVVIASRPPADWLAAELPRWNYVTEVVEDNSTFHVVVQDKPFRLWVHVSWETDKDDLSYYWACASAQVPLGRRLLGKADHAQALQKLDEDLVACLRLNPGITLLPGIPE